MAEEPQVVLGPIIGLVLSQSARILLEVNNDAKITIECVPVERESNAEATPPASSTHGPRRSSVPADAMQRSHLCARDMRAFRACAFVFEGLQPNTTYTVRILGATPQMDAESPPSSSSPPPTISPPAPGRGASPANVLRSSFTTLPSEEELATLDSFPFVTLSCNDLTQRKIGAQDTWSMLWELVQRRRIFFIAHIGDQI